MIDASLAIRNLLRNRRRSVSTLLALAIGLMAILLFGGFKTNIRYSMLTAYVRTGGHLQIQHRDFFLYGSGNPTAYGIADYEGLLTALQNEPALKPLVAVSTPMLRLGGIAGNFDAGISRTVIGTGYVAPDINRMRLWNEFNVPIVHPPFVLEGAAQDSAIVGVGVARVLQLCEPLNVRNCPTPAPAAATGSVLDSPRPGGDQSADLPADIADLALTEVKSHSANNAGKRRSAHLELLSSSGRGAPNVAGLNVLAAEDQGFKELDEIAVILHLQFAQRLVFGKGKPRATAIMVQLHRTTDQAEAARQLRDVVARVAPDQPLVVRDFEELNPFYVQSLQLFDVIFGFIFILIGGIVLFTVGNTMNAAVVERTVEIGTLRSIGLRQAGVRRLFVLEGFVLGCLGALLGALLAIGIATAVNHSGLTWLPPGSSEWLPLQLRITGEYLTISGTAVLLILVATLSAWLPAWRAARLNVVEALRHA